MFPETLAEAPRLSLRHTAESARTGAAATSVPVSGRPVPQPLVSRRGRGEKVVFYPCGTDEDTEAWRDRLVREEGRVRPRSLLCCRRSSLRRPRARSFIGWPAGAHSVPDGVPGAGGQNSAVSSLVGQVSVNSQSSSRVGLVVRRALQEPFPRGASEGLSRAGWGRRSGSRQRALAPPRGAPRECLLLSVCYSICCCLSWLALMLSARDGGRPRVSLNSAE